MKHDFNWDSTPANEVCFKCDNGFAHKCEFIRTGMLVEGCLTHKGKIYFCPNFTHAGQKIDDYEDFIAETYDRRVRQVKRLESDNRKLKAKVDQAQRTYREVMNFINMCKKEIKNDI